MKVVKEARILIAAAMFAAMAAVYLILIIMPATPARAGTDDSVPDSAFVAISLVNQNPDPVAPGASLELRFKVENLGTQPANDVVLELVPRYPFVVDEGERTKQIGSLGGRQKGKDAVIAKFFLKVDEGAGAGINQLAVRHKRESQGWAVTDGFNVSVGQRDLPLAVTAVLLRPEIFVPGEKSEVGLEIANLGSGDALNVRARLNFTDATPFAGYGSTNEVILLRIAPKSTATANFTLLTNPAAKSAVYTVPLFITYSDELGNNYTRAAQSFGLVVSSPPKIAAAVIGGDLIKFSSKGKVTIEIVNKGLADVKFLTATLQPSPSEAYHVLSPSSAYVGDLDSGDSETVSYEVFFAKQEPLVLSLEYRNALNNQYKEQAEVQVKVYTGGEVRKFGLEKNSAAGGILIIVVIVLVGVLAYLKLRKKR